MKEIKIAAKHPALARIGVAAEYFPAYQNGTIARHRLDAVLLSVIIAGEGTHYLRELEVAEHGGSVAVTYYGEEHSIVTAPGKSMDIVNIYLDLQNFPLPPLPASPGAALPVFLPPVLRAQHNVRRLLRLEFPDISRAAAPALAMARECKEQREGYLEAVQAYFKVFLLECCRAAVHNGAAVFTARNGVDPQLEEVCRELETNSSAEFSLAALAAISGYQKNYFCRKFKEYTGRTPFTYLQEQRIARAAAMLRQSDAKLLAVALACGYNDLGFFTRMFKRLTGLAPSVYRKKNAPSGT